MTTLEPTTPKKKDDAIIIKCKGYKMVVFYVYPHNVQEGVYGRGKGYYTSRKMLGMLLAQKIRFLKVRSLKQIKEDNENAKA